MGRNTYRSIVWCFSPAAGHHTYAITNAWCILLARGVQNEIGRQKRSLGSLARPPALKLPYEAAYDP